MLIFKSEFFLKYRGERILIYSMKKKEKDQYGNYIYYLDIEDHGTPHVEDYAEDDLQKRIINPDEIIIS